MAIKASCPSCQKSYTVADTQLGKKVRCKNCAYVFEVHPEEDAITDSPPAESRLSGAGKRSDPDDRPDENDRPARRPARDRDEDEDDRPSRRRDRDEEEDERPRRKTKPKPKKGGIPVWVWLVGGGGILLMLLVCGGGVGLWAVGVFRFGNTVTKENYEKIKDNMSEAEVRAILGRPTEVGDNSRAANVFNQQGGRGGGLTDVRILVWKSGQNQITCGFVKDKLVMRVGSFQTRK